MGSRVGKGLVQEGLFIYIINFEVVWDSTNLSSEATDFREQSICIKGKA